MATSRCARAGAMELQPDGHRLVAGRGLILVGAAQPVPPRQGEPEVPVQLGRGDRMVDPVHVRRHEDAPERGIDPTGQAKVRVIEHGADVQEDLERHDRHRGGAEDDDERDLEGGGDQALQGVEAKPGGGVERGVGVVDAMEPPEHGHVMHQDVLSVDRKIERDHRSRPRRVGSSRRPPFRGRPTRDRWPGRRPPRQPAAGRSGSAWRRAPSARGWSATGAACGWHATPGAPISMSARRTNAAPKTVNRIAISSLTHGGMLTPAP